jgi:DNA-binding CsgD family transcriptional regulator
VVACLQHAGYEPFPIRASVLRSDDCCALILIEPRERDWTLALDCDLPVVLLCDAELTYGERAALVLRGADALVTIDQSVEDFLNAVDTVVSGGSVFDPIVARTVARTVRRNDDRVEHPVLTQRETVIIDAIARGQSVKETARQLDLSVRSVHLAQRRLFERIGARNRAHALSLVYSPHGGSPAVVHDVSGGTGEVGQWRSR